MPLVTSWHVMLISSTKCYSSAVQDLAQLKDKFQQFKEFFLKKKKKIHPAGFDHLKFNILRPKKQNYQYLIVNTQGHLSGVEDILKNKSELLISSVSEKIKKYENFLNIS